MSPEDLLDEHDDAVGPVARRLRAAVLTALPDAEERVRPGWHALTYHDHDAGYVCGIFPAADRVGLVFERGARMNDPHGLLVGAGRAVRSLVLQPGDQVDALPLEALVQEYVDLALAVAATERRRG